MFFHLSINQYAPVLIRFWFIAGSGKKGSLYDIICNGFAAPSYRNVWGCEFFAGLMIGFGLGVYFLRIQIAEKGLDPASILALSDSALRRGTFVRNLPGLDWLHWGDGVIMVNADRIWLDGKVAPEPDYRLYLTPKYVETRSGFQTIKAQSLHIEPIKAFENFPLDLPDGVDVTNYWAVLIWCEAFGQFITAAELQ